MGSGRRLSGPVFVARFVIAAKLSAAVGLAFGGGVGFRIFLQEVERCGFFGG